MKSQAYRSALIGFLAVAACGSDDAPAGGPDTSAGRGGQQGDASASGGTSQTGGSSGTGVAGQSGGAAGSGGASGSSAGSSGDASASGGSSGGGSSGAGGTSSGGSAGNGPTELPCTRSFEASTSLSDIQSAVNSANAGDVLCLPRGGQWTGVLRISNRAATPTRRLTICAADPGASRCGGSGGPNPILRGNGGGITIDRATQGLVVVNLDVVCGSNCGSATGVAMDGVNHVRFEGGSFEQWNTAFMCNSFTVTTPCDDIEYGIRGNPLRVQNNSTLGFWGWLSNSYVRIDARNNGGGTVFDHHWYLSSGPRNQPSQNVVFEDGYYTRSSVSGDRSMGTFLNFSGQNQGIVIRNNVFEDTRCATYIVDCGSGGEDPEEFCEDLEIHGNVFRADCPVVMNLESTQRPRIYNNVFDITGEVTVLSHVSGERRSHNAWFFNNTITCSTNCAGAGSFRFQDTDNRFFNNLFAFFAPGPSSLISGCAAFGGGSGPDFDNNFLYRSAGTTSLPSCAAGSANSTTYATNPSFIDAAGGNFDIGAGSPAAGFGTSMGAPSADFDGRPRPNPPSAGAFDVN